MKELSPKPTVSEKQVKAQEHIPKAFDKFHDYVTATNHKSKNFIRSCALATSVFEVLEHFPRPLRTNTEIDDHEFYWTEMLDSDHIFKPLYKFYHFSIT